MRIAGIALALVFGLSLGLVRAEKPLQSGNTDKVGGPFQVKAITGEKQGTQLCYFCQYSAEARPAVVMIFTQKADENMAKVVKAVDEVQKTNAKLGTVVVGVGGVAAADMEKLQTTHKLTTPLTIAVDKDGPGAYKLNKDAAVTILVYKKGGADQQELRVQGHHERCGKGQRDRRRRRGRPQVTSADSDVVSKPRTADIPVGTGRQECRRYAVSKPGTADILVGTGRQECRRYEV